ncbi:uncharacterized protein CTHT_0012300 [Thermochaetoides thermophila DSM 1495]|uniref:LYR family protein n=1 Tax=Chaetomium thermophilum (strain DSM 1495 / CBS 144.50 / IMI 039719) TaxID=759272 RepID=G0S145_CHATD|nr:hypothetical protein CTHT_0012300 [Thermochaetoides thermophila DSM 1495]EGS22755.1 hypothetical protein CTHT_0012300 [Thermochaetoides thermophila DSM 1495]
MAPPQFRTATQTRRGARSGFVEQDDFEGLPVRQWRQEWVTYTPPVPQEVTQQSDRWAVELPFGMPRESHLLPPHSQELLRAARSGRLYKRPAPEEEDVDVEVDTIKGEKKDWETPNEGFTFKAWKQVPRNAEAADISYLAKRPKNIITLAAKVEPAQPTGPTITRAIVRRIDAAGNPYEQTITLTEGQKVDGEIISTTVVPAPTTQPEIVPQQTTPARRRPPPPKRKAKGVGRGRKKGKLPLPMHATRSQNAAAAGADAVKTEDNGVEGVKVEDAEDSANPDSEMADVSGVPSDEEEGEEDEEVDEEGGDEEGGETPNVGSTNGDVPSQEPEDTEMSDVPQQPSTEEASQPPTSEGEPPVQKVVRFQTPSIGTKLEGSPLKNVMVASPTEPAAPSNDSIPPSVAPPSPPSDQAMEVDQPDNDKTAPTATTITETPEPQIKLEQIPSEPLSQPPAEQPALTTQTPSQDAAAATESEEPPSSASANPADPLKPPASPALLPTVTNDNEDDGLNLLDSLERELNKQEEAANAAKVQNQAAYAGGGGGGVGAGNPGAGGAEQAAEEEEVDTLAVATEEGKGKVAVGDAGAGSEADKGGEEKQEKATEESAGGSYAGGED